MCVVSMVMDHYDDKFRQYPWVLPSPGTNPQPSQEAARIDQYTFSTISRQEFDDLKRQVEEMLALLKKAKDYDARNQEPDCESENKMKLVREIAKLVGVDLDAVITSK